MTFCIKGLSIIKLLIHATKVALGGSSPANNKAPTAMSQGPQKPETSHTTLLMVPAVCFPLEAASLGIEVHNTSLPRVPDLSVSWQEERRRWQGGRGQSVTWWLVSQNTIAECVFLINRNP